MTLDKNENKERMKKNRATEKEAEQMAERTAIIDGVAAKLSGQLDDLANSIAIVGENLEHPLR